MNLFFWVIVVMAAIFFTVFIIAVVIPDLRKNRYKENSIACKYATDSHRNVNHLYDGRPYDYHLAMVVAVARRFIYLVPDEYIEGTSWRQIVIDSCWCHDVIEDCRQTYNDVKRIIGVQAADIVYACTNLRGKIRAERAGPVYYADIRLTPKARYVKICDRIANIEYSINVGSRMVLTYMDEHGKFCEELYADELLPMFEYMRELFVIYNQSKKSVKQ